MFERLFPTGLTHYLCGGLLIGAGVALLFVLTGQIGGMSSFFTTTWSWVVRRPFFQQSKWTASRAWRLCYALGVVAGGALWLAAGHAPFQTTLPWWRLLLGGLLVGYGARLSGGCTSGHGVCGLASLQKGSLVAVATFLTVAILVAHAVAWLQARGGVPS